MILRPGDILALPFHCEQRYSRAESGGTNRLHVIRLSFAPAYLPALPLGARTELPLPPMDGDALCWAAYALREARRYRGAADTAITETLLAVRSEAERRAPGYPLLIHSLCVRLTILLARAGMPVSAKSDTLPEERGGGGAAVYHVGAVKAYLRTHLREPIGLAEVAATVGLSPEHIVRLFKTATGRTIFEHLRHLRISEAKSLLASTDRNLSEIARQTGFASLTVFSRNFSRAEGVTPSEYRRRIARQIG